ncbi:transcriptional regulator NrdR [Candidatus Roizmanbacteria bacterium CG22_combo_CG10-13_8_21_14_all_38_20]|uniref:Transcriptional repressor NrdR n=1 Tax=Candidatus Roizmanbacteria bacterium CG22_combo_CG10-13_8_21_14_all_38_20 TaxID=1974862 RepID=A0A2H0BW60_9BACT|nr:transcriptional repressor NrdR [Candidatus Microgenomates bacterium]PIP61208.1 MAG: transcriptional regulator NrdR [Candidatus Roizmanbacteria bacterium CG22_combo_CG10-13_8_21_14_all_38_20]PJC31198.1 MAG: transcriptional regulator NrdR [Candidatus Roizmanbacteria bacterium CG_4_9_14_0_2_um_filter_38_17]
MICPFCSFDQSKVMETRDSQELAITRRRRECLECEKRYTTYERIETEPLIVKKKDGKREQFDRNKVKNGVLKASERTKVSHDQIDEIINKVEQQLRNGDAVEIESGEIGNLIADHLKVIDKVAYIRFASVFKRFVEVEEFQKELKKIL